jgi:hypothetical protein
MIMAPLMATAAEATDMLRVGRSAVYRLIAARQRESIKIGRPQRTSIEPSEPATVTPIAEAPKRRLIVDDTDGDG